MHVFRCLLVTGLLLVSLSCGTDPLSASITVKYEVTGTAESAHIDYFDSNGDLASISYQTLPWETTFSANNGDNAFLSACRTGSEGTVTVKIFKNGTLLYQDTSADGTHATAEGKL
jgi:hypothetical protein